MKWATFNYKDFSIEERIKMATHYKWLTIQPNSRVLAGFVDENGMFVDLYYTPLKAEAKRLKLKEYRR